MQKLGIAIIIACVLAAILFAVGLGITRANKLDEALRSVKTAEPVFAEHGIATTGPATPLKVYRFTTPRGTYLVSNHGGIVREEGP
jgi:hypothetical protein